MNRTTLLFGNSVQSKNLFRGRYARYDPNHIRAQLVFSQKEQYLRYGYQLYVLNEDTAALVGSDIRWVGIGIVNDTVYAIGHAADKKQTEGSGYTALYQIDN